MTIEECEKHVGQNVIYRQNHPDAEPEDGKIVGVRFPYAMVLYAGDYNAKATRPEDLTLAVQAA